MTGMVSILARWFLIGFYSLALERVGAVDWPEGYIVHEGSESPNGQYGIAVPESDDVEKQQPNLKVEEYYALNYLADVKKHQVLGKIRGSDYFEHQNHADLRAIWAKDSRWCILEYDRRFGFASISILEPNDSTFAQTEIGDRVQKTLDGVIKRQSHDSEASGEASTYYRFGSDQKLRVRAISTTDPKGIVETGSYCALFQGTFDVRTKKWVATDARPIKRDQYDAAETAFDELDTLLDHTSFETQDKTEWLDERMNEVYNAVRVVFPPNRLAKIKQEQIEWLKKRDAASSPEEKNKLIEARIRALQDLLW